MAEIKDQLFNKDNNVSHMLPNYPLKEPVFFIPRIPNLIKVPEPKPPKKPPPPGYDMKTLRKQLDFLNKELDEKTHIQALLYGQNEQLWMYIQDLMEANKTNANLMRQEVKKIHHELNSAYKERYDIAQRLELARNSSQLVKELNRELKDSHLSVEEVEKQRRFAELELMRTKEENAELEDKLQQEVEKMEGVHDELEEWRIKKKEHDSMYIATDFFLTHSSVLRSAYSRFKAGIKRRQRLGAISNTMQNIYFFYLKTKVLDLWRGFLYRRKIKLRNEGRRRREALEIFVSRWKLFTVLEKMFAKAKKQALLRRCFNQWMEEKEEKNFECKANKLIEEFHAHQKKKKFFNAWKNSICFLNWNHADTLKVEHFVFFFHFRKNIFNAWARVARLSAVQLQKKIQIIPILRKWRWFHLWHDICSGHWRRRGQLLKRFFRRMAELQNRRISLVVNRRKALGLWAGLQKKRVLRKWISFTKNKKRHGIKQSNFSLLPKKKEKIFTQNYPKEKKQIMQIVSQVNRKLLFSGFYTFSYITSVWYRQSCQQESASTHFYYKMLQKTFSRWITHSTYDRKTRIKKTKRLLRKVYGGWVLYWKDRKIEKNRKNLLLVFEEKVKDNRRRKCLLKWVFEIRCMRRMRKIKEILKYKNKLKSLRISFRDWRCKWSKTLFWRLKELKIERNRQEKLYELNKLSLTDLENDKSKKFEEIKENEENLLILKDDVEEGEIDLKASKDRVFEKENEKQGLIYELKIAKNTLHDLMTERERLRGFEQLLLTNQQQVAERRRLQKLETDRRVQKLQKEGEALRIEVETARSQSARAEKSARDQHQRKLKELDQATIESKEAEELVNQRRQLLVELESEGSSLQHHVSNLQTKFQEISRETELKQQNQSSKIRAKTSSIRVLRSNTGLAEARVGALEEIVRDRESMKRFQQHQDVYSAEQRELQELEEMKNAFENDQVKIDLIQDPIISCISPSYDQQKTLQNPISTENEIDMNQSLGSGNSEDNYPALQVEVQGKSPAEVTTKPSTILPKLSKNENEWDKWNINSGIRGENRFIHGESNDFFTPNEIGEKVKSNYLIERSNEWVKDLEETRKSIEGLAEKWKN